MYDGYGSLLIRLLLIREMVCEVHSSSRRGGHYWLGQKGVVIIGWASATQWERQRSECKEIERGAKLLYTCKCSSRISIGAHILGEAIFKFALTPSAPLNNDLFLSPWVLLSSFCIPSWLLEKIIFCSSLFVCYCFSCTTNKYFFNNHDNAVRLYARKDSAGHKHFFLSCKGVHLQYMLRITWRINVRNCIVAV